MKPAGFPPGHGPAPLPELAGGVPEQRTSCQGANDAGGRRPATGRSGAVVFFALGNRSGGLMMVFLMTNDGDFI